jgi:hypothetical protein
MKVGCHEKTVIAWEVGRHMPRDGTILRVIAAVRAEPTEFLQEVAARCIDQLRHDHDPNREGEGAPTTAGEHILRADELRETVADHPVDSSVGSIGPELKELHRAIDRVVVGLATTFVSQGRR